MKRTEVQNPNNLLDMVKVLYDCQSEVEDKIIGYQLLYYVKEMRWGLYKVG